MSVNADGGAGGGGALLHYQLTSKIDPAVNGHVWKATDTKLGREVAVKILTRSLPKDPAKREALVREVRLGAAFQHENLVAIREVAVAGDTLFLVMDLLQATPIVEAAKGVPLEPGRLFGVAFQLAEALALLHERGIVHGGLKASSVLQLPDGRVKLGGLGLTNLDRRRESRSPRGFEGSDPATVRYVSPEQVAGNVPDLRSDIYSLGALLYHLGTGRPLFDGATAEEVAQKITREQPQSPKAIHPGIDPSVVSLIGKSIFKDPTRRFQSARLMVDEIKRADPKLGKPKQSATAAPAPDQKVADKRRVSYLLVADLPSEVGAAGAPASISRRGARLQQLVGENVYLFDGTILDPFSSVVIAEMPDARAAIEAARRSEGDLGELGEDERIEPRIVILRGEVATRDSAVVGPGVDRARSLLAAMAPLETLVTADVLKDAGVLDAGKPKRTIAGVGLFAIPRPAPEPAPSAEPIAASQSTSSAAGRPADAARATAPLAVPSRNRKPLMGIAIGLLVVATAAGVLMWRKTPAEVPPTVTAKPAVRPQQQVALVARSAIFFEPVSLTKAAPTVVRALDSIRLASIDILRGQPTVEMLETPSADAMRLSFVQRAGKPRPEIIVQSASGSVVSEGPVVLPSDPGAGIANLIGWIGSQLQWPAGSVTLPDAAALRSFSAAVTLAGSAKAADRKKAAVPLRATLASAPAFMPAQRLAMRFFAAEGKSAEAQAAAAKVIELDPSDLQTRRLLVQWKLKDGKTGEALDQAAAILEKVPDDGESLQMIGRWSAAVGDVAKFQRVLARLGPARAASLGLHEPDILMAAGRIDAAASRYYDLQASDPQNPHLALKIGRIAALRRSLPMMELELKKLESADPSYGFPLLKAYLAAQTGGGDVDSTLRAVQPDDSRSVAFHTSCAEIFTMQNQPDKVIVELEQAVATGESTGSSILSNPLFGYLESEARFQTLKQSIQAQKAAVQASLGRMAL